MLLCVPDEYRDSVQLCVTVNQELTQRTRKGTESHRDHNDMNADLACNFRILRRKIEHKFPLLLKEGWPHYIDIHDIEASFAAGVVDLYLPLNLINIDMSYLVLNSSDDLKNRL